MPINLFRPPPPVANPASSGSFSTGRPLSGRTSGANSAHSQGNRASYESYDGAHSDGNVYFLYILTFARAVVLLVIETLYFAL